MKALAFLLVLFFVMGHRSLGVNNLAVDSPSTYKAPEWAPYYMRSLNVRYYYFPDLQIYYDLGSKKFIFPKEQGWSYSPRLPFTMYGELDLYETHVVPLESQEQFIFQHFEEHRKAYPRGYRYHPPLEDSPGNNNPSKKDQ